MTKRKTISKKTRFEVFKRDSFTCQYCGQSAPEVVLHLDHIKPVSKDGADELVNYLTSCIDCNLGKGNRELSDNSVIKKQKAQLDELQERRDQIEMMLEWRNGLKEIEQDSLDVALRACLDLTPGWTISPEGEISIRKLLKKFGLKVVLDAIEASSIYLKTDHTDDFTADSVNVAFNKIGGICRLSVQPDWMRELYYIRGIMRKRFSYCNDWEAIKLMKNAHEDGVSLEQLKDVACQSRNWTTWMSMLIEMRSEI